MANRIPPSLNWLIDKRARLAAEIQKTRKSIIEAQKLIKELRTLEKDLDAVDRTFRLHGIAVDIANIPPITSHYVRINLPHGELTKSIYLCLKLRENRPTTFSDITSFIVARHADLSHPEVDRARLNRSIHYRLKGLASEGKLQRHHLAQENKEGVWSMVVDDLPKR